MIGNDKHLRKICKLYHLVENYITARFDTENSYDLHHIREITENKSVKDLIKEGKYYDVNPNEVIFIKHSEHIKIHHIEDRAPWYGKQPWNYGLNMKELGYDKSFFTRNFTDEYKNKISSTLKNKWLTDSDFVERNKLAQKNRFSKDSERQKARELTIKVNSRPEYIEFKKNRSKAYYLAKENGYTGTWNDFQKEYKK